MLNSMKIIIGICIFVMLLIILFRPIKSAFNLNTFLSCVLSVCVSALCIIGMGNSFGDSFKIILLPYVAMGISIIFLMLFVWICKLFKKEDKTFDPHRIKHLNKKENDKLKDND